MKHFRTNPSEAAVEYIFFQRSGNRTVSILFEHPLLTKNMSFLYNRARFTHKAGGSNFSHLQCPVFLISGAMLSGSFSTRDEVQSRQPGSLLLGGSTGLPSCLASSSFGGFYSKLDSYILIFAWKVVIDG